MLRAVALLLTVFTGFTGLVYEVTWQKYVATLLGSHSEATSSVLGIFLAGLSIGYSVFGRVTRRIVDRSRASGRPARLLLTYGAVEIGIGCYALVFPRLFEMVRSASFAIPHGDGGVGFAVDVALVAVLLLPPTLLMGGTIPLLTQALGRDLRDATRFHALVYGFNTVGAFVGALAAGFVLVPALGLEGVMTAMGLINLAAGLAFVLMEPRGSHLPRPSVAASEDGVVEGLSAYAFVALLSGFALMALQTVVMRVGGLSLGSSGFTFATVVAVFVLCIALGSFAVSAFPRVSSRALVLNQWALVAFLMLIYFPMQEMPYWAHMLRLRFGNTPADFIPFYLASFIGFLVLVGPAAILSGAILPLLFHHLRRESADLGAVAGKIYSWNTVGSLLGALLGGYALLFFFDLHHIYRIAVAALAVSAAILTLNILKPRKNGVVIGALIPALLALFFVEPWNPDYLSMGLFRIREPLEASGAGIDAMVRQIRHDTNTRIVFYQDDPTASVAVTEASKRRVGMFGKNFVRAIITNGKPDGSTRGDYPTMALAALLPAMMAAKAERSFVIGFGTGITVGELAALDSMKKVVVAEISPGVMNAAPLFDFANHATSTHAKVEVRRRDAYRALMRGEGNYDIIVSEPSNPWVTGVEMLYSREFLTAARSRLSPGGVYLQWYHRYETDHESVALVLRTYAKVFDRVAVWYSLGPDFLIFGFDDPNFVPSVAGFEEKMRDPQIKAGLARAGIRSLPALTAHELWPAGVLKASNLTGPIHTLYHPILSHVAGSAFFRGALGDLPPLANREAARVGLQNSILRRYLESTPHEHRDGAREKMITESCRHRTAQCAILLGDWRRRDPDSKALARLIEGLATTPALLGGLVTSAHLDMMSRFFGSELRGPPVPVANASTATGTFRGYYQYGVPFNPMSLVSIWQRCAAAPEDQALCTAGLDEARALVPTTQAQPEIRSTRRAP